jgi:hypothetical protein
VLVTGTRAVITACSLLSVLALGACSGGDPEPRFAPSSSSPPTSPSTTAASDPVPPTMPAEAKGTDAAAAEAFVRFYWEMVNYAQATGDLRDLRVISSMHCVACRGGIGGIEQVVARGGRISGGVGRVSRMDTTFLENKGVTEAVVEFVLATSRQIVDYPGSDDDQVFRAGSSHLRAVLSPTRRGWVMTYWGTS